MTKRAGEKLPFAGKKVYFSSSIVGVIVNAEIGSQLIKAMQVRGATVTSEHVGIKNRKEMFEVLSKNAGEEIQEGDWQAVRRTDTKWVDEATHVIAIVDGPSHGVGMELERALLKPERGLPVTPILALIQEGNLPRLTSMIRGITDPQFKLATYRDISDAKRKVIRFLSTN